MIKEGRKERLAAAGRGGEKNEREMKRKQDGYAVPHAFPIN